MLLRCQHLNSRLHHFRASKPSSTHQHTNRTRLTRYLQHSQVLGTS